MSLKEYNNLTKQINDIYVNTCLPCMRLLSFFKGKCNKCETMKEYIKIQERKKELEITHESTL